MKSRLKKAMIDSFMAASSNKENLLNGSLCRKGTVFSLTFAVVLFASNLKAEALDGTTSNIGSIRYSRRVETADQAQLREVRRVDPDSFKVTVPRGSVRYADQDSLKDRYQDPWADRTPRRKYQDYFYQRDYAFGDLLNKEDSGQYVYHGKQYRREYCLDPHGKIQVACKKIGKDPFRERLERNPECWNFREKMPEHCHSLRMDPYGTGEL